MTPVQWHRVRELFEQAIDMDPGQLQAWLNAQEGDDAVIAEVRSLLDHHTRASGFLAPGVSARVPDLLEEDEPFESGTILGAYTIQQEIGRGGMGRVYLATDQRLGRSVALKVLAPRLVRDESQRERLRQEARAAASLNHPGICTIYALEEVGGHVAIAAEYINGHTLRDEIEQGRRPSAQELADNAAELSAALAAAHARGITHRDLKPENVMRTITGQLKILDFGLALVESQDGSPAAPRVTTPGMLIGTPLHMAPEQLTNGQVDVRTDVFALGVLLYEFATGAHPFAAESSLALVARILEGEPQPILALRPDLPSQVASIVERCLRKNPAERYASAGEVLLALAGTDRRRPATSGHVAWWRTHLLAMIALYLVGAAAAWLVKEWFHGLADAAFIAVALIAAVGGVFRSHLLFTERTHDRARLLDELSRTAVVLTAADLAIAVVLLLEGLWTATARPVAGVLIGGLAIWFALSRLWFERNTTDAAFDTTRAASQAR